MLSWKQRIAAKLDSSQVEVAIENMKKLETSVDHNGFNVFHRAAFDFSTNIFEEAKEIN